LSTFALILLAYWIVLIVLSEKPNFSPLIIISSGGFAFAAANDDAVFFWNDGLFQDPRDDGRYAR
jgi:hypothetical protein